MQRLISRWNVNQFIGMKVVHHFQINQEHDVMEKNTDFTSRLLDAMPFGNINPGGITPFDGDVAIFVLYKGFLLSNNKIIMC